MSEKLIRVLFVSSWYPSRVNNMLGNFVQKHAEAASLYADIAVLHVCFDENVHQKDSEIVFDESGKIKSLHIYCKKSSNPLVRLKRYIKAYREGLKYVVEKIFDPDLIHANIVFPAGILFYLKDFKKYPYILTEHWAGYLPEYPERPGLLKKYLLRKIIRNASAMLPVTEDLAKAMQNIGFKGNYKVIPNVVDTAVFTLTTKTKSALHNILHISSLDDRQKNATGIINVISRLYKLRQDFALHIVSDGDRKPFIAMAEKDSLMDKTIFFHGPKSTKDVAEMMQQSDLLVLFSNYENMPCVIIEAYACGLPVLSTDVGGIAEHHTAKHGLLIKANDEEGLLKALLQMMDNIEGYDREYLHDYAVKHFSYEVVGKQLYEIYKKVSQIS